MKEPTNASVIWDGITYPVVIEKLTRNAYAAKLCVTHKKVKFDVTIHGRTPDDAMQKLNQFLDPK